MQMRRWQDWIMFAFGVWLIAAPFVLSYGSLTGAAAWNSYLLGLAVAGFAIGALSYPRMWEETVNLLLGIWLILAPFVLGFNNSETVATQNHLFLGILIAANAAWAMMTQRIIDQQRYTGGV